MNTKLSIALLSGLSFFMSVAAFAVADEKPEDYLNWSYAMGETQQEAVAKDIGVTDTVVLNTEEQPTCTEGCPGRMPTEKEAVALTISYEDEAAPIADQTENNQVTDTAPVRVKVKEKSMAYSEPETTWDNGTDAQSRQTLEPNEGIVSYQGENKIETRYVTAPAKVEYPITRQYPVSVEYPVTVQRNMTVEQPVIVQQPVVVRRPVVMQQDITVQRQPTIVQNQPVVMNQQPTYVQQQPMYVQAPAQPISPVMMTQIMPAIPTNLPQQMFAQQPMMIPMQPMGMPQSAVVNVPQQYHIQGQVQAQPVYMMQDMSYGTQSVMPSAVQPSVQLPQPAYPNQVRQ